MTVQPLLINKIAFNDVLYLITRFNEHTSDTNYDLNHDSKVDVFDLVLVAKNMV